MPWRYPHFVQIGESEIDDYSDDRVIWIWNESVNENENMKDYEILRVIWSE
jgi:hypothetical protein